MEGMGALRRAKGLGTLEMVIHFRGLEGAAPQTQVAGKWLVFHRGRGNRPHPDLQLEGQVPIQD